MARCSVPIMLSCVERSELECLIRSHSTPQHLALRARMIVLAAAGVGVGETAQRLGVWRKGVSFWRARWRAGGGGGAAERLADAPRSGAPATITAEQTCAIVALACERLQDSGGSAQPLERRRPGARGDATRHRQVHLAPLGRALFKKNPTSSRIASASGSRPGPTLTSRPSASTCAASIAAPSKPRRRRGRCRSTR